MRPMHRYINSGDSPDARIIARRVGGWSIRATADHGIRAVSPRDYERPTPPDELSLTGGAHLPNLDVEADRGWCKTCHHAVRIAKHREHAPDHDIQATH